MRLDFSMAGIFSLFKADRNERSRSRAFGLGPIAAACMALASLVSTNAGFAQDAKDFETNGWALLTDASKKGEGAVDYNWLFGTPQHIGNTQDHLQVLKDNTYPLGQGGQGTVECTDEYGKSFYLSHEHAQNFMEQAQASVDWHQEFGFPKIGPRFNAVPVVKEITIENADGSEETRLAYDTSVFQNLVTCLKQGAVASVAAPDADGASIVLSIEDGIADFAEKPVALSLATAHEVAHIYQEVMMPIEFDRIQKTGAAEKSLVEGFADASGIKFTFDNYGGQNSTIRRSEVTFSDYTTNDFFMARAYNVPLLLHEGKREDLILSSAKFNQTGKDLLSSVDSWMESTFSYKTSGFYYHLIERYLDNNPAGIEPLYGRIDLDASKNLYPALDAFLNEIDGGVSKGLAHVLPQFHAEYADWGDQPRTEDPDLTIKPWLNATFGGCYSMEITQEKPIAEVDMKIAKFAGKCVDVILKGDWVTHLPELKMILSSKDGNVREIYGSLVKIKDLAGGDVSCFTVVELIGARGAPCLLDPIDGALPASWPNLPDPIVRSFYLGRLIKSSGDFIRIRLMFTHVPEDLTGHGYINADAFNYKLKIAVGTVNVTGGDVQPPTVEPGPFSGGFVDEGISQIFVTGRLAPITTHPEIPQRSMYQKMLEGGANIPGIDLFAESGAGPSMLFGFQAHSKAGEYGVFMNPERVPAYGELGRVKLNPMGGGHFDMYGEEYALYDETNESYADIFVNSPEALVYFGEVHICTFTYEELMAEALSGRGRTPCQFGRPRVYFIESSIAFPEIVPGAYRLPPVPPFAPIPPTPAYEKYKNLRLERIGSPMGTYPDPADALPGSESAIPGLAGGNLNAMSSGEDRCDCSCEGQEAMMSIASPRLMACNLLCGKTWKNCEE